MQPTRGARTGRYTAGRSTVEQFFDAFPISDRFGQPPAAHQSDKQHQRQNRKERGQAKTVKHERRSRTLDEHRESDNQDAPEDDQRDALGQLRGPCRWSSTKGQKRFKSFAFAARQIHPKAPEYISNRVVQH
jgi:hypothetical protein